MDAERNLHRNDVSGSPTSNQQLHLAGSRGDTTWLAATFDVPGPIDTDALKASFEEWTSRHDALSCSFSQAEESGESSALFVDVADVGDLRLREETVADARTPEQVRELLGERLDRWCNPFAFPAYFLGAITREDQSTVVCGFDHAICDGWSMSIAITEISTLYREYTRADRDPIASDLLPSPGVSSTTASGNRQPRIQSPATTGLRVGGPSSEHAGVTLPFSRRSGTARRGDVAPGHRHPNAPRRRRSRVVRPELRRSSTLVVRCNSCVDRFGHNTIDRQEGHAPTVPCSHASGTATQPHLRMAGSQCAHHRDEHGQSSQHCPGSQSRFPRVTFTVVRVVEAGFAELGARGFAHSQRHLLGVLRRLPNHARWISPRKSKSSESQPAPINPQQLSRVSNADDVQFWFSRTHDGLAVRTRFSAPAARTVHTFLSHVSEILSTP
ncbi:condensation domain-containing protein [Rhodococcus sp. 3Y1]